MATTTANQVQQLYVGLLGRAADQGGLNWWVDQVTTGGKTLEDIRASFVTSTEYKAVYGATTSRSDLVKAIYSNLFERTPSADEVKFWAETDTRPADQLVAAFIQFASANDMKTIDNKVFVANTYTSTVGADFDAKGAAAVIANVDGTAASVSAATAAIANGSLAGQVPALGLINGLSAANAAQETFETANKAAVDKLAATLKAAVVDDFSAELTSVSNAATLARGQIKDGAGNSSTSVLTALAGDAAKVTATAYGNLNSTDKAKADAYVSAVKVDNALQGAAAADVAAVKVGLKADTKFVADPNATTLVGAVTTIDAAIKAVDATYAGNIKTADDLYTFYTAAGTKPEVRTAIDTALKDVPFYNTFKATAAIDAAKNDAHFAVTGTTAAKAFTDAYTAQAVADKLVTDAKAADVSVDAAKALVDSYKVQTEAVAAAAKAIGDFNSAHTDLAAHNIAVSTAGSDTVKDVFYFASKVDTKDYTVAAKNFGAGDSIVLSKDLSFNKGALSTGDNNKAEFFLVQKGNDTLVVIETKAFGSSTTEHTATGDAAAVLSPEAAVITLTGVTADHLAVNNGVISYV